MSDTTKITYETFLLPCKLCGGVPVKYHSGFKCSGCGFEAGVIGGLEFAIVNWNSYNSNINEYGSRETYPAIKIDGEDWNWGCLETSLLSLGSSKEYEKDLILFKTSKPLCDWFIDKKTGWTCIIDTPRFLPDLEIMDIRGNRYDCSPWLNMPKSSSKAYAYIQLRSSLFSNSNYPQVCIETLSPKLNII